MRLSLVALAVLVPGIAIADEEPASVEASDRYAGTQLAPPDTWRLMVSDLTILRLNPIGLETRARVGLQKRLFASAKPIARNNFAFAGIYPKLNPATAYVAAGGELQPLSIFNLRASFEVQKYFGTFGFLQSFESPDHNYSDQTLADLDDQPGVEPQATTAIHASLAPLVQLKVGDVAVRALVQLDYWDFSLRPGDTVAYEATFDTLLPDQGWSVSTDTDVLYTGRPGLAIGLRHTWVRPLYEAKHFADDDLSPAENLAEHARFGGRNAHHRLGLFAAYTLRDRGPSRFNKPTIIMIASWYLAHRYRTGAPDAMRPDERADDFTSRAFPYLLAGFAFESDLLPVR